jgi:hypothetical protein
MNVLTLPQMSRLEAGGADGGSWHRGPNSGVVAIVFTILKLASLFPVTIFGITAGFPPPYFPAASAPPEQIVNYFTTHTGPVLMLAFLQFGSAIPLGIFTASIVSRLQFLGIRAAGASIALFGGLAAAFHSAISAFALSVTTQPGIAQEAAVVRALNYLAQAAGGPGYAVAIGLLMAGVSVTAGLTKLLPKWIVALGLLLAVTGELSWLAMLTAKADFLVPLTRFPGFIWMIAAGLKLPARRATPGPPAAGGAGQ